jgi:hypothetical protein
MPGHPRILFGALLVLIVGLVAGTPLLLAPTLFFLPSLLIRWYCAVVTGEQRALEAGRDFAGMKSVPSAFIGNMQYIVVVVVLVVY